MLAILHYLVRTPIKVAQRRLHAFQTHVSDPTGLSTRVDMHQEQRFTHIDGLRGVAILLVLCYHAQVGTVTGGFIGVDVFFVISGYLITATVWPKVENESFSFMQFFRKRIHRLYPAFLIALCVSLFVLGSVFSLELSRRAGKASIAALLAVSNFYFCAESGYFDKESGLKPFLHTWSLSVEWHFYLSWSLYLYIMRRRLRTYVGFMANIALAVGSLACCEFMLSRDKFATAFFITPFRYFEFLIGAVPAILLSNSFSFSQTFFTDFSRDSETSSSKSKLDMSESTNCQQLRFFLRISYNFLAIASFVSLIFLSFHYSDSTRFPGMTAVPVCVLSSFLILCAPGTLIEPVLTSDVLVWIGKISYPLYLLHWPALVIFNYLTASRSSVSERLVLLVVVAYFSFVLHVNVELPFQISKSNSGESDEKSDLHASARMKTLTLCGLLIISFILGCALATGKYRVSFRQRSVTVAMRTLNDLQRARATEIRRAGSLACHLTAKNQVKYYKDFEACNPRRNVSIAVFGDSHGADVWCALNHVAPDHTRVIQATGAGCGMGNYGKLGKHCVEFQEKVPSLTRNLNMNTQVVFLVSRWEQLNVTTCSARDLKFSQYARLRNMIQVFKSLNMKVVLVGPVPEYYPSPGDTLSRLFKFDSKSFTRYMAEYFCYSSFSVEQHLEDISQQYQVPYISVFSHMCSGKNNLLECRVCDANGRIFYSDSHHMNSVAWQSLGSYLMKKWLEIDPSNTRLFQDRPRMR